MFARESKARHRLFGRLADKVSRKMMAADYFDEDDKG